MKLFLPMQRAALLIPSGPAHDPDRMHLFILLTDAVTQEKLVLIVSVVSLYQDRYYDSSCVLELGEHDFITRRSWVDYRTADIRPANALSKGVHEGIFVPKGTIEAAVFTRICRGLLSSKHIKPKLKNFYLATL